MRLVAVVDEVAEVADFLEGQLLAPPLNGMGGNAFDWLDLSYEDKPINSWYDWEILGTLLLATAAAAATAAAPFRSWAKY